jgi:4-alpha-glucanotransferase
VDASPESLALLRRRLLEAAGVTEESPPDAVVKRLHRALAASPSVLVAATLEDALGVRERTNQPGTVAPQRDNWNLALPVFIEALETDPSVLELVAALRR